MNTLKLSLIRYSIVVWVITLFPILCYAESDLKIFQSIGGEGYIPEGNRYIPGKELIIKIEFTYMGVSSVTALGLVTEVPQQCTFEGLVSGALPPIYPTVGTGGKLEFAWIFIPSFPFEFSFKVKIDEEYASPLTITSYGMYRTDGPNITTDSVSIELICECATSEGEGEVGYWFDPCDIGECEEVGCDVGEVLSSFEEDLRWFYGLFGEDADVADLDGNGVLDVAQAWILDGVLGRWDMGIYCCVLGSYLVNLEGARVYADEVASLQPVVFMIVDRVRFERVVAGIMTVGERSTVEMLLGMIDDLPLEVPLPDMGLFDVSSSRWLSMYGDADMDGVCNLGEYRYAMEVGEGLGGYKLRVLDGLLVDDGGGCVWCGEGESPYEGEGGIEGGYEGEGVVEGEVVSFASLTVVLEPEDAIASGAQWKIEGDETWRNSGDTVTDLSAGVYRVFFYQPQGWVIPQYLESGNDFLDIELDDGEHKEVTIGFIKVGELCIKIYPLEAVNKGAKWKVRDTLELRNSGDIVILPVGWVEVEFSDVEGYIRPQPLRLYIPFANRISVDVSYQKSSALTDKEKRNLALLLWATFSYSDINGDGYLSYDEVFERYPQIPIDLLIEIDSNKDGKISREELENYLMTMTKTKCGCIFH